MNVELPECAGVLRALADPTRLEVIRLLLDEPRHVSKIMTELDVEQSLLSHHLRVLRDAELVEANRNGKTLIYRLVPSLASGRGEPMIDLGCCRIAFN